MLKLILTGVWVAVVTLGSVYASIELSKPADPAEEEAKKKAIQELVRGEMVTIPVLKDGLVEGYFMTKTSYVVDKTKMDEVTLPIPALLTDELYTALVGDRVIRVEENRDLDVAAFRERLKKALNARLGDAIVLSVIIEQIDYLSKADIRNSASDKSGNVVGERKIVSEKVPDDLNSEGSDAAPAH